MTNPIAADARVDPEGALPQLLALHPPRRDPIYRALTELSAARALEDEIRKAWSRSGQKPAKLLRVCILHTHYKPWSRGRVLARAVVRSRGSPSGRVSQFLFLQVYPSAEQARRRLAANHGKAALKCKGPPVFLLECWNAVAWSLPNGPKLRPTRVCFHRRTFGKLLAPVDQAADPCDPSLPDLVRYVPRRRALFRYEAADERSPALYFKFYGKNDDESAASNLRRLASAAGKGLLRFRSPALLAHDPRRRVLILEELPGVQLSQLLPSTDATLFAAVGRALASLHASQIEPPLRWTFERELSALREAMRDVEKALPPLAGALAKLIDRIQVAAPRLAFEAGRPIHGNLYGDQILIERGQEIGIVDWDDLCTGDPLYDVGRLVAHCIFVWRQRNEDPRTLSKLIAALLNAYSDTNGNVVVRDRLRWQVAVGLLMRAKISALRPLSPNWIEDCRNAAVEADRVLSDNGPWLRGH